MSDPRTLHRRENSPKKIAHPLISKTVKAFPSSTWNGNPYCCRPHLKYRWDYQSQRQANLKVN